MIDKRTILTTRKDGIERMADNDNDTHTTQNQSAQQQHVSQPDYDRLLRQEPTGTTVGDSATNPRDLGTVGGGTVPSGGSMGSGKSPGGINTSDNTITSGGTTGGANAGGNAVTDRGKMTNQDITQNTGNTVDSRVQGNIDGRTPAEPQMAMGDQDPQKNIGQPNPGATDPMTSRDPNVGNPPSYQENNP